MSAGTGGAGGTASGGSTNINGTAGSNGVHNSHAGAGSNAPYGGSGGASQPMTSNGYAGGDPGAGGGGGRSYTGSYYDEAGGGGSGGYVEKTYTPATLVPSTTISDVVVGDRGNRGAAGSFSGGGYGGYGRVSIICTSSGNPTASGGNDQIAFFSGGGLTSTSNFVYTSAGRMGVGVSAPQASLDVTGAVKIGSSAQTCTSGLGSAIRYVSGGSPPWEYCNGSAWLPFERAPVKPGYLVQTATRWNGNLGGLAGANAKCLTELQTTYNWRGKSSAGVLTSTRVKAFLCDGSSCNNLQPDTAYITAKANNATNGGIAFVTDSSGRGYGFRQDADYLNFDSSFNDWLNRATVDNYYWDNAPADASQHCSNWSSSSNAQSGCYGNSGWDDSNRWNQATDTCNVLNYLVCIVHP